MKNATPTCFLASLCLLMLAVLPSPTRATDASSDPVISGVLELLEADLSEDLVLDWLSTVDERPAKPSASDLVALRKAGASDRVLHQLLAMARGDIEPRTADTAPSAPAPAATAPSVQTAPPPAPAPRPAPTPRPAPVATGPVAIDFAVSYSMPDLDDVDSWGLYLYLDGQPLTYVAEGGDVSRFRQSLEPGSYRLLITQEQHDQRKGVWQHESRAWTEAIDLTVEPGDPAEFELRFRQGMTRSRNPVSWRFAQGTRVDGNEDIGGHPRDWPHLCEDIETNLANGAKETKGVRKAKESCVTWNQLWTGQVPDRTSLLKAMAQFDFRPVPKSESIH